MNQYSAILAWRVVNSDTGWKNRMSISVVGVWHFMHCEAAGGHCIFFMSMKHSKFFSAQYQYYSFRRIRIPNEELLVAIPFPMVYHRVHGIFADFMVSRRTNILVLEMTCIKWHGVWWHFEQSTLLSGKEIYVGQFWLRGGMAWSSGGWSRCLCPGTCHDDGPILF